MHCSTLPSFKSSHQGRFSCDVINANLKTPLFRLQTYPNPIKSKTPIIENHRKKTVAAKFKAAHKQDFRKHLIPLYGVGNECFSFTFLSLYSQNSSLRSPTFPLTLIFIASLSLGSITIFKQ